MKNPDPKISVVVPVFNVEDYLCACIESIINQSFRDLEIILVNDGSTDSSLDICNTFSARDQRITVINQKNTGLSGARNSGIKAARGEYILFVDSDDFIENTLHEITEKLNQFNNTDVMFLEAFKYFDGRITSLGDRYIESEINNQSKEHVLNHLSTRPKYPASAWSKLIRRKLITENNIIFPIGLFSEDLYWTADLLLNAEKFSYCNSNYYFYRQNRSNSITNVFDSYKFECILNFVKKYAYRYDKETMNAYECCMLSFAAYEYTIALSMFANLDKDKQNKFHQDMHSLSWLLNCRNDKKSKAIKYLYSAFGLHLTSRLLKIYLKARGFIKS